MNYTGRPSISGCRPVLSLYPTHRFCQYLLLIFITFTNSFLFNRAFSTNSRKRLGNNLSVKGSPFGGGAQPLRHCFAMPPPLPRGGLGSPRRVNGFARGSPTRGNGDDRRQWRKQGGAVGAAASRMRAAAKQTLGAATRPCRAKQTERLYEGEPDREPLLGSTSPSALTRCHLPYRGEALA